MGTFITENNWFTRAEGAALFGWGTSITGPVATRVDEESTHDRHHFVGWPQNWVVKKPKDCGGTYGNLRLEVKCKVEWVDGPTTPLSLLPYYSTGTIYDLSILPFYTPSAYDPYQFPNGDGHVYTSYDFYVVDGPGSGSPGYRFGTADSSGGTTSGWNSGSNTGGLEASSWNDSLWGLYVGNWSGKLTPQGLLDYYVGSTTITESTTYFYAHKPGATHWSRTGLVVPSTGKYADPFIGYDGIDYLYDIFGIGMTFLWDEDWTAVGVVEKITCKFRWKYNPQTSTGCKYWQGAQAQVKVLYKKAPVTKTNGPDGVFYTIGTWSSAGNDTQTVTLHDKYTDEYVGSEVNVPAEEGYVYVIDDVEILSVTLP